MSVRTYVGFVAEFPTESNDDSPPGQALASFVVQCLKDAGYTVEEPDDREGWAWNFYTRHDKFEILSIVGLVDDMDVDPPRQWLITNDCELGFFRRYFGSKSLATEREEFLRQFCEALHQIVSTDARFSHIVWHSKSSFDQPDEQPGKSP